MAIQLSREKLLRDIEQLSLHYLDDITSGFWSVIEINVGVIVISLPPLRTSLSRQFSFFNRNRTGSDGGSYHPHSNQPSQLVTIGGSRPRSQTRKNGEPDDSEEKLVFVTGENNTHVRDGSILKHTEFVISERIVREGDADNQDVLKPMLDKGNTKLYPRRNHRTNVGLGLVHLDATFPKGSFLWTIHNVTKLKQQNKNKELIKRI